VNKPLDLLGSGFHPASQLKAIAALSGCAYLAIAYLAAPTE
jgi:hypothetical protein